MTLHRHTEVKMAATTLFLRRPQNLVRPLMQIRWGSLRPKKPRAPHPQRAVYNEVVKPRYDRYLKGKTNPELCLKEAQRGSGERRPNPYGNLLGRQLLERFTKSPLVVVFHRDAMDRDDFYRAHVYYFREKMWLESSWNNVLYMGLEGTPYEGIIPHIKQNASLLFCENVDVKKVFQVAKRIPKGYVIMFAVLYGRLICRDELLEFVNIPNLETAQLDLVSTLDRTANTLVSQLSINQNLLVSHLEQRAKQLV